MGRKPVPSRPGKGKSNQKGRADTAFSSKNDRKGGKSAGSKQKVVEVDSDEESNDEENDFLAFNKKGKDDSDEESEQEIFNISTKKDDDDSDEDENESEEGSGDDDESDGDNDDDYDEDEYQQLNQLVRNLPADMKRKILSKKDAADDLEGDEEGDEEDEETTGNKWGKKKTYWSGDTADLEIGQGMEDAYAEEEAAKEIQQQKLKRLHKKDFYDDLDEAEEDSDDQEDDAANQNEQLLGNRLQKKAKKAAAKANKSSTKDKLSKELEAIVVGDANEEGEIQAEQLAKDISGLTKDQKLQLITSQAPELINIVKELRERIEELQTKVNPIKSLINQLLESKAVPINDDLVDYIEMKQQLLLSYCLNVVYYLSLKTMGKSVRNHPVMKQMLKLRYAMEKLQGLDSKLKYQIDRLLKLSQENVNLEEVKSGLLRPNLSSFLGGGDEGEEEEEEEEEEHPSDDEEDYGRRKNKKASKKRADDDLDEEDEMEVDEEDEEDDYDEDEEDEQEDDSEEDDYNKKKQKKFGDDEVYRPPKLSSTHYPDERSQEKQDRQLEKKRQKLKHSELMDSLREEFGTAPELSASTGTTAISGDLKRLEKEQAERLRFEEERFVRTTLTRKEKKDMKKRLQEANRLDNFEDIGDYEDLEDLSKMIAPTASAVSKSSNATASSFKQATSSKALEQAMKVFNSKKGGGNALDLLAQEFGGDEDEGHTRKRRRAPAPEDEDEGGDNMFDDFIDQKKQFKGKKKEHYTAEPRYGGVEEKVHDGDKRAISYEIMKNRGLTAHKKKSNRNPRVKKREAFEKALVRRKGQVRDVITGVEDHYGGEMSGIKANLSRSRKMRA